MALLGSELPKCVGVPEVKRQQLQSEEIAWMAPVSAARRAYHIAVPLSDIADAEGAGPLLVVREEVTESARACKYYSVLFS